MIVWILGCAGIAAWELFTFCKHKYEEDMYITLIAIAIMVILIWLRGVVK